MLKPAEDFFKICNGSVMDALEQKTVYKLNLTKYNF